MGTPVSYSESFTGSESRNSKLTESFEDINIAVRYSQPRSSAVSGRHLRLLSFVCFVLRITEYFHQRRSHEPRKHLI